MILIKFLYKFIEVTLRHWRSPVHLLHIFRAPYRKNTSGRLLLYLFLRRGRKCVDLVVIFNKGREETFAVFLQKRKSCVCIRYLTLVRPRKLIPVNFAQNSFIAKKLFISQFFKQIKLCHCLLLFKKHFSPQKMFVMFMCTSWRLLEQYI